VTNNNTYVESLPEHHSLPIGILVSSFFLLIVLLLGSYCYSQQQTIHVLQRMVTEQQVNLDVQEKVLSAWKKTCKKIP